MILITIVTHVKERIKFKSVSFLLCNRSIKQNLSINHCRISNNPNMRCDSCDITYTKRRSYHSHLKLVHNIATASESAAKYANKILDVNDPDYQCIGCKKNLRQKVSSFQHLYRSHYLFYWYSYSNYSVHGAFLELYETPTFRQAYRPGRYMTKYSAYSALKYIVQYVPLKTCISHIN